MAVDLRFYSQDGVTPLSTDKVTGGIDFGVVRKSQQQIIPVVLKNLGTTDATNVSVKGSPLHTSIEVPTADYNNEVIASAWQTFSLLPDGDFTPTLSLPNIGANKTMVGKKRYVDTFTNPSSSLWKNDTLAGHVWSWSGNSLILNTVTGTNTMFAYASSDGWGTNKEYDTTFQLTPPATSTTGSAFVMWCFRKNCLGDNKGYLLNMKRTSTAVNSGTFFFEIRKGAGIKTDGTGDYGTVLATSVANTWYDFIPIRIKVFTNSSNLPEIKIWVNNIKDSDPPIMWGATNQTSSWVDTLNTYPYGGGLNLSFGTTGAGIIGANSFEIKYASLTTDDSVGKVYIKTLVGDGAVDSVSYNSAMEVIYD